MTIMTQGNSEGSRRCDGTCHKARKPKCACICGGRYHGKGSSEAAQQQLTKDWLGDDWKEQKEAIEAAGGSFSTVIAKALNSDRTVPVRSDEPARDYLTEAFAILDGTSALLPERAHLQAMLNAMKRTP